MNAQQPQPSTVVVRPPSTRAALVLALGTLVVMLALAWAQATPAPLKTPHAGDGQRAALPIAHTSPIITAASSAYDGQVYQATRAFAPVVAPRSPIQRAASSAYDGQQPRALRPAVPQPRSTNPIQAASSSAYDGH